MIWFDELSKLPGWLSAAAGRRLKRHASKLCQAGRFLKRLRRGKGWDALGAAYDAEEQDKRFAEIFAEELGHLDFKSCQNSDDLATIYKANAATKHGLSALCISGGGIRSASFALGMLQSLARNGLLDEFDYISTVSGGGYIGSFLSAWRKQCQGVIPPGLTSVRGPLGREAAELVGLRADSNYLTPRLGVFSADTWTALAVVVRNLLLNWAVFVPFFMAVLLVPWALYHFLEALSPSGIHANFARWIGVALLFVGDTLLCVGLSCASYGRRRGVGPWMTEERFRWSVVVPIVLSSLLLAMASRFIVPGKADEVWLVGEILIGSGVGAVTYAISWLVATSRLPSSGNASLSEASNAQTDPSRPLSEHVIVDFLVWVIAGGLSGAILAYCLCHLSTIGAGALTVGGVALTMLSIFAGELVYVALRSYDRRSDMDREWLARAAGWLGISAVAWSGLCSISLYGYRLPPLGQKAFIAAGGVSGVFTLVMGWSAKTAATDSAKVKPKLTTTQWTSFASIVFAFCLSVAIATLNVYAGHEIKVALGSSAEFGCWLQTPLNFPKAVTDAVGIGGLALFSVVLSYFVNVNRFSLHGLYRNRLVRTFLGSARLGPPSIRRPDPFTGFDPADNPRMHELAANKRPLHIINVALNIVSTKNLAWQERKAMSFTISPLRVGCPIVGYRKTSLYAGSGGGITLGTAMAISGAAVSPNMGYHTSPLISFLLMLFNVRLGCWLGNPACPDYGREGPRFGLLTLLKELANLTTADGRWIYLSDGGHFDNLGLYEMLRRRCRTIVVSDAGCDPKATLADLGDSLRKASIDFGVSVVFDRLQPSLNARPPTIGPYCWVAHVKYAGVEPGKIVYFRPNYTATETADVRSYAEADATFPHDSTTEQWFGERQFEAYRALGQQQMDVVCEIQLPGDENNTSRLDRLVERARQHVASF